MPNVVLILNTCATNMVIKNNNPIIIDNTPEVLNNKDFFIDIYFLISNAKNMNTMPIIVNTIKPSPAIKSIIINNIIAVNVDPDIPKIPPTLETTGSGLSIPVIDGGSVMVIICDSKIPIITHIG